VIGIPGDQIAIRGGAPEIGTKKIEQVAVKADDSRLKELVGFNPNPNHHLLQETLPDARAPHWIQRYPYRTAELPRIISELKLRSGKNCIDIGAMSRGDIPFLSAALLNEICPFVVPADSFFVMGDNRDDSADGREWGFVSRHLLKGRALFIWFSWLDWTFPFLRWSRIGLEIK
jgi:signal peptidase I